MPSHGPPRPPAPRASSRGSSSLASAKDVGALLVHWVRDDEDRAFVSRCIATEGPAHHRLASYALLKLLAQALDAAGGPTDPPPSEGARIPLRLPPHLDRHDEEEAHYPLTIPRRALARLAPEGSREAVLLVEALTDGPAHHALANAAMVCMLDALIERLTHKGPP